MTWLLVLAQVALGAPAGAADRFRDDDGTAFEPAIEWLAAAGITRGCNPPTNDRYCPDDAVTRGQMAAFLTRALRLRTVARDTFRDDDGTPFEPAIEALAAAGITRGCNPPTNDRFCPSAFVTRGQMAAFLVRAYGWSAGAGPDRFRDDDASPFEPAIEALAATGVTRGCNPPANDRFCPDAPVTRGQMAAFLQRAASVAPVGDGGGADGGGSGGASGSACADAARWSAPGTWGGTVPVAGQDVTIAAGRTVRLDTSTPSLGRLRVEGTLLVCNADADVHLTVEGVTVTGTLRAGTTSAPRTTPITLTLTGARVTTTADAAARGLVVRGGRLELHGARPSVGTAVLAASVPAGTRWLQLDRGVGWRVGDEVLVTPTDRYGYDTVEVRTVTAVDGDRVQLDRGLDRPRWGVLQHVTASGLSLTPDPSFTPPTPGTPTVVDERARVVHLSRAITIEGRDDSAWRTHGFGAHVQVRDRGAVARVEGVRFTRVGQRSILGRYPIHWHRMSYGAGGSVLADVTGQYVRGSVITGSANRCITVHATNGLAVTGNVCHDIEGHGVFLEDGVERRTTITGNVVAGVRDVAPAAALKLHETDTGGGGSSGASAFWLSNPDNTVTGNLATDAAGFGYWCAFARAPVGLSSDVAMHPDRLRFGTFADNVAAANRQSGVMLDFAETDEAGHVLPNQYWSTTDGQDASWPYTTLRRFHLTGLSVWKNGDTGIWTRATSPTYTGVVNADNADRHFAGAGAGGDISSSLVVGRTLNGAAPYTHWREKSAFATYHSTFDMHHNVVVGFDLVPGATSGVFATNDYYIRPVEKGQARNAGNVLIDSHPGHRDDPADPMHAFAGALWDPHGVWGAPGSWNVYPRPFLTHGATCSPIAGDDLAGTLGNAVSCDGEYLGLLGFVLDRGNPRWDARMALSVDRLDDALAVVDTWSVATAPVGVALGNMRHVAARNGGTYLVDFPSSPVPTSVGFEVENLHDASDSFVVAVRFDGDEPADVYLSAYYNYDTDAHAAAPDFSLKRNYTAVGSRQAVLDATTGVYWQDTVNDLVWVRVVGGLAGDFDPDAVGEHSDEALYNQLHLRIW